MNYLVKVVTWPIVYITIPIYQPHMWLNITVNKYVISSKHSTSWTGQILVCVSLLVYQYRDKWNWGDNGIIVLCFRNLWIHKHILLVYLYKIKYFQNAQNIKHGSQIHKLIMIKNMEHSFIRLASKCSNENCRYIKGIIW